MSIDVKIKHFGLKPAIIWNKSQYMGFYVTCTLKFRVLWNLCVCRERESFCTKLSHERYKICTQISEDIQNNSKTN